MDKICLNVNFLSSIKLHTYAYETCRHYFTVNERLGRTFITQIINYPNKCSNCSVLSMVYVLLEYKIVSIIGFYQAPYITHVSKQFHLSENFFYDLAGAQVFE